MQCTEECVVLTSINHWVCVLTMIVTSIISYGIYQLLVDFSKPHLATLKLRDYSHATFKPKVHLSTKENTSVTILTTKQIDQPIPTHM